MTADEIIATLREQFGDAVTPGRLTEGSDPFAAVPPGRVIEVAQFLRDDPRLGMEMLNCVSGVDYCEPDAAKIPKGFQPRVEVVYHFSGVTHNHRVTVKVVLPRWKGDAAGELPEVPSLVGVYPAADWHERETFDLCGVRFVGHPDLRRILTADDWEGHPLRKDYEYPLEYHGIRGR